MNFKIILIMLAIVLALAAVLVVNSGKFQRTKADYLGYSTFCIDGVSYLQFSSGATVQYRADGTIARCE